MTPTSRHLHQLFDTWASERSLENKCLSVFVGCVGPDRRHLQRLSMALNLLEAQGHLRLWSPDSVLPGAPTGDVVTAHLDTADIVLLLLSPDFLASPLYSDVILRKLLASHLAGYQIVIPIIVRACDWASSPLGELQALPRDSHWRVREVTKWSNADVAWDNVAKALRRIIDLAMELSKARYQPPQWTDEKPANHTESSAQSRANPAEFRTPTTTKGRQRPNPISVNSESSEAESRADRRPGAKARRETIVRMAFVMSGTVCERDRSAIEALLLHLQGISGDSRLTLLRIEDGSIRLLLRCRKDAFQRLLDLHRQGKLESSLRQSVPGIKIEAVDWINDIAETISDGADDPASRDYSRVDTASVLVYTPSDLHPSAARAGLARVLVRLQGNEPSASPSGLREARPPRAVKARDK